jgi:hypothetical protein
VTRVSVFLHFANENGTRRRGAVLIATRRSALGSYAALDDAAALLDVSFALPHPFVVAHPGL